MIMRVANVRIDGVNEGGSSVLCTLELIWQRNVGGFISMLAMVDLELPLCKVGLSFNIGVETHILMKVKNCDLSPQNRSLHAGAYNLSSRTLKDNWQDLLEVSTKDNSNTTKRLVRVAQVLK